MSILVVDASVGAKWYFEEPHSEAAWQVLDEENLLHVPQHFLLEMDSLIIKRMRRRLLSKPLAHGIRRNVQRLPLRVHETETLRNQAFEIAAKTGASLYDCLYVALAVHLDAQMVTADRHLHRAFQGGAFGRQVLWIEDLP